jgi:hypothetical protein
MHYLMHSFNKRYGVCIFTALASLHCLLYHIRSTNFWSFPSKGEAQDRSTDCHHAILRQIVSSVNMAVQCGRILAQRAFKWTLLESAVVKIPERPKNHHNRTNRIRERSTSYPPVKQPVMQPQNMPPREKTR